MKEKMNQFLNIISQFDQNDKHCPKILAAICSLYPRELGFNELRKELNQFSSHNNITFSRTTLSKHLNHLVHKDILAYRDITESKLKIKPRKYRLSHHIEELFTNIFIHDWDLNISNLVAETQNIALEPLTVLYLDIIIGVLLNVLRDGILYPDKIAEYNLTYNSQRKIEVISKAYTQIVIEKKFKEEALDIIKKFDETWKKFRNNKWGDMIQSELQKIKN